MIERLEQINAICTDMQSPSIHKAFMTCYTKLRSGKYNSIVVSISGGADSDMMLDIIQRVRSPDDPIIYVFFDTGIEYQATKEHLKYLEEKYQIKIQRLKAQIPVPLAVKKYGVPFLSKQTSSFISRLQKHGFNWVDKPYEELISQYPNCSSALRWWCNKNGNNSSFNINKNFGLKDFLIAHPPTFNISEQCCTYAKKNNAKKLLKSMATPTLNCVGARQSEGGIRSTRYKTCFSPGNEDGVDNYRPLFFISDVDKEKYENIFSVQHSKCYTHYGLTRTGCAGCPFNSRFEEELAIIKNFEPNLYDAICNIFGFSYEYKRECILRRRTAAGAVTNGRRAV